MNNFRQVNDQRVRQLAETLKQNGLAASESEAIRMATSMASTEDRVTKHFDANKDAAHMKTRFSDAPPKQATQDQPAPITTREEETHAQAPEPAHPNNAIAEAINNVQAVYEEPPLPQDKPLNELMNEEPAQTETPAPEPEAQQAPEPAVEPTPQPEAPQTPAPTTPEPVVENPLPQEEEAETTKEVFEKPPKKDVSSFAESQVDLSNVFDFSKR